MGEAQEQGPWPRRTRSSKEETGLRARYLGPPLKRGRHRETRSTTLRAVGGAEHRDRTRRRARDLSHHGLQHVRQSGDPEKAGMDVGAVFVATCLAAAAGSIIMGLYANYPIALCGNARRSPPHLHHDGLYRELGRRRGGRPDGPHRARRRGTVSAEPIPRPARPDRAALCYGARAHLRRMPDGGESRRHQMGGSDRIHPWLLMPLSYSIATGIGLGFIAYVVLKAFAGGFREINAAVGVIAAFLLKLIFA